MRFILALEADEDVKVVVFDSAVEGFFLTHYDFLAPLEDTIRLPPGPTACRPFLNAGTPQPAPVVSIVSIRGRATGVGSELALASDMRFASSEKAFCRNGRLVPPWAWRRTDGSVARLSARACA